MTTDIAAPTAVTVDRAPAFAEAIAFVWREAELLDRLDYRPWLSLWAEEGLYVVPVDRDAADPRDALNIVYDDKAMRDARVKRLLSGFSMSSAPPARTVRTVSRFVEAARGDDWIEVRAAQVITEYKYQRMRMLPADVEYRLRRAGDGTLHLVRKVVTLINADDFQFGIGYLL